jgi:DNA-binding transcriptional ArsR family regulator
MSSDRLTFSLDRRLLRHPRAYHLRRMRMGLWLYLALLARIPAGAESVEIEPAAIGEEMGLPEATVRSWLGHLRKAGYVSAERLNGSVRISIRDGAVPEPIEVPRQRFFTAAKLRRALGDAGSTEAFDAVLEDHADTVIQRALAGALAVPEAQIRRSRTALFFFLLKRYSHANSN